jgi:ketosteroid isomerase-like protein
LPVSLIIEPLGGESEAGYCTRLRQGGQWGSTAEVLALTKVLQRPIRVHTPFGVEPYGDEADLPPLSVYYENHHYRAVVESQPPPAAEDQKSRINNLRGGATGDDACAEGKDETAIHAVLNEMQAASAAADGDKYFALFAPDAVFLGTDPNERWPLDQFRKYAGERFAEGNGWSYAVQERHITVRGDSGVAWFDERLHNAKLGDCRGSGVLVRDELSSVWRIAQYNLLMTIPNEKALEVAAMVGGRTES